MNLSRCINCFFAKVEKNAFTNELRCNNVLSNNYKMVVKPYQDCRKFERNAEHDKKDKQN